MKSRLLLLLLLLLLLAAIAAEAGPRPELFAPGVISTADDEFGGTFNPDGTEFYFVKKTQNTLRSDLIFICMSRFRGGKWTEPEIAPFSGKYKDLDPFITPDGSRLYFASTRRAGPNAKPGVDIWFVERQGAGWGEPKNLGAPINCEAAEFSPSVSRDGTIYFAANRKDSLGGYDIYRSPLVDGKYTEPENLGPAVNSAAYEQSAVIAPDESFLVFSSLGRDDALAGGGALYPRADLYISYRKDGKWTPAENLGPAINSAAEETNPFLSPDGRYLYFSSERNFASIPMPRRIDARSLREKLHAPGNGLGDIFRVALSAVLKR